MQDSVLFAVLNGSVRNKNVFAKSKSVYEFFSCVCEGRIFPFDLIAYFLQVNQY